MRHVHLHRGNESMDVRVALQYRYQYARAGLNRAAFNLAPCKLLRRFCFQLGLTVSPLATVCINLHCLLIHCTEINPLLLPATLSPRCS